MRNVSFTLSLVGVLALAACGQAPSFVDATTGGLRGHESQGGNGGEVAPGNEDGTVAPGASGGENNGSGGGSGDSPSSGGVSDGSASGGGSNGGGSAVSPPFVVPGANPNDNAAIQRCLAKWKNLPFPTTITNYKRIYAAVSINSNAVVVDDPAQTSTPQLILVDAGVTVGGSPIYNLRNQNGYYCMKVSVNVNTNLNINLACNARLADSLVQVNVKSDTSTSAGAIGINVGSNVIVKTVDQTGAACHQ